MSRKPVAEIRSVRCLCSFSIVVLKRRPRRGGLASFGGVCSRCGRGIDLLIEKKPANEVRRGN